VIYSPDTNLVIARLKENDGLHGKAVAYLGDIPPRHVRLLSEVYNEANEVLREKTERVVQEIFKSAVEYMAKNSKKSQDLDKDDVTPIIDLTLGRIGIRNEGFYHSIGGHMMGIFDFGQNPFLAMPVLTNAIAKSDIEKLNEAFFLMKSGNKLLEVTDPLNAKSRFLVEDELRAMNNSFFSMKKNERDLRITGELAIVCKEIHDEKFEFAMFDKDFYNGMKEAEVQVILAKYHGDRLNCIKPR